MTLPRLADSSSPSAPSSFSRSLMPSNKKSLAILFLIVFLDLLGVGIIIPVLTPLMLNPESMVVPMHFTEAERTITLGFLIASYPFFQFIGAPILGKLSDQHGRKKILTLALIGTFAGYVLFAIGILINSLPLLFFSRAFDGFTGGNIAVANSAIADLSPDPRVRAKNFGFIGMAFGLGFILGPFIGGVLSDSSILPWFGPALPFWMAAGLALLSVFSLTFFFKEPLKRSVITKLSLFSGIQNIRKAFRLKKLQVLFLVIFLHAFGFAFFTTFFQVYLVQKFAYTPAQIGLFFAYVGIWIVIGQGGASRIALSYFSSKQILRYSLPALALSIAIIVIPAKDIWLFLINPAIAIFEGLVFPNLTGSVSELATEDEQGEVLGITQSVRALAEAFPPMIAGFLVIAGQNVPILSAAFVILLASGIFLFFFRPKAD